MHIAIGNRIGRVKKTSSWNSGTYLSDDGFYIRKEIRDGYGCTDKTLTALGFAGIEDTDWTNIEKIFLLVPTNLTVSLITGGVRLDWDYLGSSLYEIEIWGNTDSNDSALLYTISAALKTKSEIITPVALRTYKIRVKDGATTGIFTDEVSIALLGSEKVVNGTFAVNVNDWTATDAGITSTRETTIFPNGGLKAQMVFAHECGIRQVISGLTSGKTYCVSAKAYAPSSNGTLRAASISTASAPSAATKESAQVTAEDVVQTITFFFTATGSTQNFYLLCLNRGSAWGTNNDIAYFDDVTIKEDLNDSDESKEAQRIITLNTSTITEAGAYLGKTVLMPGGYAYCFIRDMVMSEDNFLAYFSSDFMKYSYLWYKSHVDTVGVNAYIVPFMMSMDGTEHVANQLDCPMYLISGAYNYFKVTNDLDFVDDEIDFLKDLIDATNYSVNGLVENPDPTGAIVSWGFHDTIKIAGEVLYVSCLAYRAYQQISEMALANGDTAIYNDAISRMNTLKSAINSTFYVANAGKYYMKASTGLCSDQFDLAATCFAIYLGIVEPTEANLISEYIHTIITEINYLGAQKWVPDSHEFNPGVQMWEAEKVGNTYGAYQSGGYWVTSLAWFIYTLNLTHPEDVNAVISAAWTKSLSTNFFEWWNSTTGGTSTYTVSASVFALTKDILR